MEQVAYDYFIGSIKPARHEEFLHLQFGEFDYRIKSVVKNEGNHFYSQNRFFFQRAQ